MNKVILIGNLTSDPNMRTTASGKSVCTMRIAVNRMYKSSDGDTKTDYFDIVTWSKLANICDRHLRKGSKVSVIGELQIRSYESDGIKKYATEIMAENVEFLSPKKTVESINASEFEDVDDAELPFD